MGRRSMGRRRLCACPPLGGTDFLAVKRGRGIRQGGCERWLPVCERWQREPARALILCVIRIEDCDPILLRISWPRMRAGPSTTAGRGCCAAGAPPFEPEAEAVERADVRGVEQRDLFRPARFVRRGAKFFLKLFAQPPAHFGGGGLGEGDHENFLERGGRLFLAQAMQATGD